MSKILSIVIPCYNRWNFTKSCLKDLSQLPNDHEIIIIDNGSSDETEVQLKDSPEIIYIRNKENLGFAKACNKGYHFSSAPNVLFLNNDVRVKSQYDNWTKPLIEKCSNALVGPTMGQLDDNLNFVQEANKVLPGKSYMSGWCIASSREIWNKLAIPPPIEKDFLNIDYIDYPEEPIWQIFSEEFGLAYFEDVDLSFRAKNLDIKFEIVNIPVVHFGRTTSKTLNVAKLYNHARNIFVKKWEKHTPK